MGQKPAACEVWDISPFTKCLLSQTEKKKALEIIRKRKIISNKSQDFHEWNPYSLKARRV